MAKTQLVRLVPPTDSAPDLASRADDLVRYFGKLVWAGMQLHGGGRLDTAPDALHPRLLAEFERARTRAEQAGFGRQTVDDATYAVVALVDSALLGSPEARGFWSSHPLELSLFGTSSAGQDLHARLDAALRRNDGPALGMYRLCLLGGFEGYRLDASSRERVLADLERRLGLDRRDGVLALFPPPMTDLAPPPRPVWPYPAAVAAILAVLVLGLLWVIRGDGAEVAALAATIAPESATAPTRATP